MQQKKIMDKLVEELNEVELKLENLYNMGGNDEDLVDKKRELQSKIRNYGEL